MAGRRYGSSEVVYDDRRERDRGSRYDDRYDDIEIRRSRGPPVQEREREEAREPAYLREDYGRSSAGPMVLRAREREDFEFVPRPRRKSPSPEREVKKESIIIRRDESERPPPRKERSREREEIIIRRDERSRSRAPPPPQEREREEIIIRRTEDDTSSRRSYRPPPQDYEREEIIIRREEEERKPPPRREVDYALVRPKSRERERSRRMSNSSDDEIIIRREDRSGRRGERDEIIIRHHSRSPSPVPSLAPSSRPAPRPEPQIVNAPEIHQEIITHHRHIDHGYEVMYPPRSRPVSRPPSPPSPPPPRERSEERIEIRRRGERNGRAYDEDIIIDRNEGSRPAPPREFYESPPPRREPPPSRAWRDEREIEEEAEYYNQRAMERSFPGEAYHGATREWGVIDIPPGTNRVRMDGIGGGSQEITWQRYNGERRSKFYPDADQDDDFSGYEVARPAPPPAPVQEIMIRPPSPLPPAPLPRAEIAGRYGRQRDPKDRLWTEITKDLVVKEAIQEMGYEYEERGDNWYIIAYLRYEDVAHLVGLSEDIRKERRARLQEIEWENRLAEEEPAPRLAIEPAPPPRRPSPWEREDERYIEREIVYRGGRPPPPPGWRR